MPEPDTRTFNQRCLDNVNALIEGRTATDVIEWANTSGINLKHETFESLWDRKIKFERLVAAEKQTLTPFVSFPLQSSSY